MGLYLNRGRNLQRHLIITEKPSPFQSYYGQRLHTDELARTRKDPVGRCLPIDGPGDVSPTKSQNLWATYDGDESILMRS